MGKPLYFHFLLLKKTNFGYNLKNDLSETQNLATQHTDKTAELRRELEEWRTDVDAEMMQPNPDYDPTISKLP